MKTSLGRAEIEEILPHRDPFLLLDEVVELAPGATTRVSLTVDPRLLATWDDKAHGWSVAAGAYTVALGASSRDTAARAEVTMAAQALPVGLKKP